MASRRRRNEGFTLIELMIAITIIVVLAALVAPSISVVLSDSRQQKALQEVLRLARKARWEAIAFGVAHMVQFDGTGTEVGWVRSFKGMGTRCDRVDWAQPIAIGADQAHSFDMLAVNPAPVASPITTATVGRFVLTLRSDLGGVAVNQVQVCYQPNGDSYTLVPAVGVTAMTLQTQRVTVTFARALNGAKYGEDRRVLLPPGETPWVN